MEAVVRIHLASATDISAADHLVMFVRLLLEAVRRSVEARRDAIGLITPDLDDIHLAATRPVPVIGVLRILAERIAECPEGRPRALSVRQLRADLDTSVKEGALGGDVGGRVLRLLDAVLPAALLLAVELVLPRFLTGRDRQDAVFHAAVLLTGASVILRLMVTNESDFVVPGVLVDETVLVELLAPRKLPSVRRIRLPRILLIRRRRDSRKRTKRRNHKSDSLHRFLRISFDTSHSIKPGETRFFTSMTSIG